MKKLKLFERREKALKERRNLLTKHLLIASIRSPEEINIYRHKLMASYVKNGKTLDVGFGNVPNQFLKNPVGLDIAKALKPKNYSEIVVGSACNMPFKDEKFDNVIAGEIVEHLENPCKFYREAYRVLKSKGRLIISTPNPCNPISIIKNELFDRYPILSDHINEIPPHIVKLQIENNGFKLLRKRGVYFGIPIVSRYISHFRHIKCNSSFLSFTNIYVAEKVEYEDKRVEYLKRRLIEKQNLLRCQDENSHSS